MAQMSQIMAKLPRPSLTNILLAVLVLLQFPLWANEGGWGAVWRLERQILAKQNDNDIKRQRVLELEAEVRDFKKSPRAAEERARYEMGLINPGERFLQWGSPPRQ
jgi:cell division protein FtsB